MKTLWFMSVGFCKPYSCCKIVCSTILQRVELLHAHHNRGGNTPFVSRTFRIKNQMLQFRCPGPQMRYWRWLVDNPIDDIASEKTRLVWSPPLASTIPNSEMRGNEKSGDAWTNGWLKFIYNLICLGLLIIIFRVKGVPIYQQSLGLNFWWFYDVLEDYCRTLVICG